MSGYSPNSHAAFKRIDRESGLQTLVRYFQTQPPGFALTRKNLSLATGMPYETVCGRVNDGLHQVSPPVFDKFGNKDGKELIGLKVLSTKGDSNDQASKNRECGHSGFQSHRADLGQGEQSSAASRPSAGHAGKGNDARTPDCDDGRRLLSDEHALHGGQGGVTNAAGQMTVPARLGVQREIGVPQSAHAAVNTSASAAYTAIVPYLPHRNSISLDEAQRTDSPEAKMVRELGKPFRIWGTDLNECMRVAKIINA